MIKIKAFYIANNKEGFYFDKFGEKLNIIHSDDNDKGKTIVAQGMMYVLGNTPTFPAGFQNFDEYYYVIDLNVDSRDLSICRKNNTFIVLENSYINVFDSVHDFKNFFNENISKLPIIVKDGFERMVDPELFLEMSFLPQDNRLTSNTINNGYYKKEDYVKALFSLMNLNETISQDRVEAMKSELKELKANRKIILQSNKFLKKSNTSRDYLSYTANRDRVEEKLKQLEKINSELSSLLKEKNRLINKKLGIKSLLEEIRSLSRPLSKGKIKCANCGCSDFLYESENESICFNVTDSDIRKQILNMLDMRIEAINESVADIEKRIAFKRRELNEQSSDDDVSLENFLYYRNDISHTKDADKKIEDIDQRIFEIQNTLENEKISSSSSSNERASLIQSIVEQMQDFYSNVNVTDPIIIDDIFTTKKLNYSGSQGGVFLMSRVYAIAKLYDSGMPIVIDEFRSGELSSIREEKVISYFSNLNRQVILTCTLKNEENNKYDNLAGVKSLSFDNVNAYHLLSDRYLDRCIQKLKQFLINI